MSDDFIYPRKKTRKQKLIIVSGSRAPGDPGLIPCHGLCSKPEETWTWHTCVQGSTYQCNKCQNKRHWGLQFWGTWR